MDRPLTPPPTRARLLPIHNGFRVALYSLLSVRSLYTYAEHDGCTYFAFHQTRTGGDAVVVCCRCCCTPHAVTSEGKLLTVGTNSKKGLLGLGVVDGRDRSRLTEVPALKGVDVVSVACG